MEVSQALADLTELSSQIRTAVVLDAAGALRGSTVNPEQSDPLVQAAGELVAAARALRSGDEVTRVEVELGEGAVFVLREGAWTIAATTGPQPTSGLVAYDLRTCLHALDEPEKPARRRTRKAKSEEAETA
jgi:hypothetical protein